MANEEKDMIERTEALMRLVVLIVSGTILVLWKSLIQIIALVHWFIVIFTAKRNKDLADFAEIWNTQLYIFVRYITFVTNERPFPFGSLEKNISKFEK